ncbi:hypothetical protein BT69DRAFT_1331950 [Atractiella rhizophila]|nr:hypothetical protein BT69DRAFT_1331950 [Atractiella rhizophila]
MPGHPTNSQTESISSVASVSTTTTATTPNSESTFFSRGDDQDLDSISLSSYSISSVRSSNSGKRPIHSFFKKLTRKVSRPFLKQRKSQDDGFTFVSVGGKWEKEDAPPVPVLPSGGFEDPEEWRTSPNAMVVSPDRRGLVGAEKEKRLKPKKSFVQAFMEKKRKRDNLPEIILTPATPLYDHENAPAAERFESEPFYNGEYDSRSITPMSMVDVERIPQAYETAHEGSEESSTRTSESDTSNSHHTVPKVDA